MAADETSNPGIKSWQLAINDSFLPANRVILIGARTEASMSKVILGSGLNYITVSE